MLHVVALISSPRLSRSMESLKPSLPKSSKPAARSRKKLEVLLSQDEFHTFVFETVCAEVRERHRLMEVESEARSTATLRAVSEGILIALTEEVDMRHGLVMLERRASSTLRAVAGGSCTLLQLFMDEAEDTAVCEGRARSKFASAFTVGERTSALKCIQRMCCGLRTRRSVWKLLCILRSQRPEFVPDITPLIALVDNESHRREAFLSAAAASYEDLIVGFRLDALYWAQVQDWRYIRRAQLLEWSSLRAVEFVCLQWTDALAERQMQLQHMLPHLHDADHIAKVVAIQRWVRGTRTHPKSLLLRARQPPSSARELYAGLRRLEASVAHRRQHRGSDAQYTLGEEAQRFLRAHDLAARSLWRSYVKVFDRVADYYLGGARKTIPPSANPASVSIAVPSDLHIPTSSPAYLSLVVDEMLQRRYLVEGAEAMERRQLVLPCPTSHNTPMRLRALYINEQLRNEARVVPPSEQVSSGVHEGFALGVRQYKDLLEEGRSAFNLVAADKKESAMRNALKEVESAARNHIEASYAMSTVQPRHASDRRWCERLEATSRFRLEAGAVTDLRRLKALGEFLNNRTHFELGEAKGRGILSDTLFQQLLAIHDGITEEAALVRTLTPGSELIQVVRSVLVGRGGHRVSLPSVGSYRRVTIHRSAFRTPTPPEAGPPPDLSDRIAYVNCVIVPKSLVCLPGSDLFKAAAVLLKCRVMSYETKDILAPATCISTSSFEMEYVRDFRNERRMSMSMSGTFNGSEADDATSILRPKFVAEAKMRFCEVVREEELDAVADTVKSASDRDLAVAKALSRRLNSTEYVNFLQLEHSRMGNSFVPSQLESVPGGTKLVAQYTLELTNDLNVPGEPVLTCDVDLPKQGDDEDPYIWGSWWCSHGNQNCVLTDATITDGTSNPALQLQSVAGTVPFQMFPPAVSADECVNQELGQLCFNVGWVRGSLSRSTSPGIRADEEDDMDVATSEDGEEAEGPTPFYLHIGAITVDRLLMEETLGSAEAYHHRRRSATVEEAMLWRRTTNASVRISVDPHFPGLPQSLIIPLEPLEQPSPFQRRGSLRVSPRAVLIPEYVRRAEERYVQSLGEKKTLLDDEDRRTVAYLNAMSIEHEKQSWKLPIRRDFGELKVSVSLQIQGCQGGTHRLAQVPLMSQGIRYVDMRSCFKSMLSFAGKVAKNRQETDSADAYVRPPTIRVSLLSLQHSFADATSDSGLPPITSRDRAEVALCGGVFQFARSDLLGTQSTL